jgi:hypothetical protein
LERVSVVAEDKHGAYEKLKATGTAITPDFQVALARWCMAWKLYEEARLELRDALVADPDHEDARQMYAKLHQLMNPEPPAPTKSKPKTAEGFEPADAESLAGLSPETARLYVTRVQPLLLNRCGNAGCHGPSSEQEFRLTHIRGRLNKQTIVNLDMVLKYVDVSSPEKSLLLTTPTGTHGKNGKPIFYGSTGEQNLETLKAWVSEAASELKGDAPNKPNVFAQGDNSNEKPDETLYQGMPEEPKQVALTPEQKAEQEKEALLNSILESEQKDEFDPEEFNRKFGN